MPDAAVATPPVVPPAQPPIAVPPAAPAVAPNDFAGQIDSAIAKNDAETADITQRQEAATAPMMADASKTRSEILQIAETPPKTLPLPVNAAKHVDQKELMNSAQVFMVLGALGGLFMRQPMTAALGNMTAAMKGVQEGDAQQYDRAMAEFKTNFDTAMKRNKQLLDERQQVLSDKSLSLTQKMNEIQMLNTKYGVEYARHADSFNAQLESIKAHETQYWKAKEAEMRIQEHHETMQLARDRMAQAERHYKEGLAAVKAIPPQTIEYYATLSLAGDYSWQIGLARGKAGLALIAAVKDRIPQLAAERHMNPGDQSVNKAIRDATNKTLIDRTKALAAATQFVHQFGSQAELVDKYLQPGVGGSVPVINRWIQAGRKSVAGDTDVTAFDTAVRGLAREHQRIVTGVTSNAQLHVSAQETADELLNKDMTAPQIKSTMAVMLEEANNAVEAGRSEVGLLTETLRYIGTGGGAQTAKPSLDAFLAKARAANPGKSDTDLTTYYNQKYGK